MIPFAFRAASVAWEPLVLPAVGGIALPVWYRPQHLPDGVIVHLDPVQLAAVADRTRLSFLALIEALGITPIEIGALSLYGGAWMATATVLPFVASPIPDPPGGVAGQLQIVVQSLVVLPVAAPPAPANGTIDPAACHSTVPVMQDPAAGDVAMTPWPTGTAQLRERIEADWHSCLQLERQISNLRQKLAGTLHKLASLDRDLNPQERAAASREDVDAWQDARRWNREASSKVHRYVKAHDVGVTSSAGRKSLIEGLYARCCTGLMTDEETTLLYHEMEVYRRLLTQLQSNMNNAAATASHEGEGRARQVLQRITVRMAEQRRQWRTGK